MGAQVDPFGVHSLGSWNALSKARSALRAEHGSCRAFTWGFLSCGKGGWEGIVEYGKGLECAWFEGDEGKCSLCRGR